MTASTDALLLDTTVLVDLLRGREAARRFLEGADGEWCISSLTVAEVFAGARAHDELPVARLISLFRILPVTSTIAQLGGAHRRRFGSQSGTSLVDALIGATAQIHGLRLATHNARHFPMMEEVLVPY